MQYFSVLDVQLYCNHQSSD